MNESTSSILHSSISMSLPLIICLPKPFPSLQPPPAKLPYLVKASSEAWSHAMVVGRSRQSSSQ